jgi:hypothetical protein
VVFHHPPPSQVAGARYRTPASGIHQPDSRHQLRRLSLSYWVATAVVFLLRPTVNQAAAKALARPLAGAASRRDRAGRGEGDAGADRRVLLLTTAVVLVVSKP